MNAKKVQIKSKIIMGVQERTSNALESDFESAKIPSLWREYFQSAILDPIPNEVENRPPYAIYSNFKSKKDGEYDVTVGAEVSKASKSAQYKAVTIEDGSYLRFDAQGQMPMATANLWAKIWKFFETNTQYTRSFKTDFEIYPGEDEVSIYIGINE